MHGVRHALAERQWRQIRDHLPRSGRPGRPWKDHRLVIDGILWILRTGAPWRDLPRRFGRWNTVYDRFRRWTRNGTWQRLVERLQARRQADGKIDWRLFAVDSTVIRAHKAAAGAKKTALRGEPADHALGRSRGGFGTKVHLVCDGRGLPITVGVSAGQAHEVPLLPALIESISVPTGGRPRRRPDRLAGDKAYSTPWLRNWLRARRVEPVIPTRSDQPREKRFDRRAYRRRNVIERCVGWIKECRRIAMRFEKLALHYLGMLRIGMMLRYLD